MLIQQKQKMKMFRRVFFGQKITESFEATITFNVYLLDSHIAPVLEVRSLELNPDK